MPLATAASRLPRPLAFLFALLMLVPCSLHAQDISEPWIDITPADGTFSAPTVTVSVTFQDDISLNLATRQIVLNGVNVTSQFTHSAQTNAIYGVKATSSAVLTLAPGNNILTATVSDGAGNPSWPVHATYTFNSGRPGVDVTPALETAAVGPGAQSSGFVVRNTGTLATAFSLLAQCRNAQTWATVACSAPAATATLAAGATATVQVSYTAVSGQDLWVSLKAWHAATPGVEEAGWSEVTVEGSVGTAAAAPQVSRVTLQSGAENDRGDCVAVAIVAGAAYECGDLRIVHGLPVHRTRGRTWAPALLYNSQHAHPRPTLYADVAMPAGSAKPAYLEVVVAINGGSTYSAAVDGGAFAPGAARRVGVQWDALTTPTGLYRYTLQVTAVHANGVRSPAPPDTGEIAIVNRAASPFGAGWWWAGWEQIICVTCGTPGAPQRMLWIGGDGSTRVYEPVPAGGRWIAQSPAGVADTMVPMSLGTFNFYRRTVRGGGYVDYDAAGRQFRTANRQGQLTHFAQGNGRLDKVYTPDTGNGVVAAAAWILTHDAGGQLQSVSATAPGGATRTVVLAKSGARVTGIQDPDTVSVTFAYDTQLPNRINGQTDRRGTYTSFAYGAAGKLSSSRLWMGSAPNNAVDVVTLFEAAESRGVVAVGTTGFSVARAHAYTRMDGPRSDVADVTQLHLDSRGLVRRVVNPVGQTTVISRTNTTFPALVTETVGPNGRQTAVYDTRGRVVQSTVVDPLGDGVNRTVTYAYDDRWNLPDTIRAPGVGETRMAYDSITGNVLWQEVGDATRRIWFDYHPASSMLAGQLARVRYPDPATGAMNGGGMDSLAYDGLGNLRMTRTPMGFLTLHLRDALGRDTLTITPTDTISARTENALLLGAGVRQRTEYDVMDRVRKTQTTGPAMTFVRNGLSRLTSTPQETLFTENEYDGAGALTKVRRSTSPNPASLSVLESRYTYDPAGRRTSTIENNSLGNDVDYDQAGNVVQVITPRATVSTARYDALGRVVERVSGHVLNPDETVYLPPDNANPSGITLQFPTYVIPADTARFVYDLAGRMVRAENRDAIVIRGYFPDGSLQTDSLKIRSWSSGSFPHVYGVRYGYDAQGRMKWMEHPSNLVGAASRDSFAYHPVTGVLSGVTTRTGHSFGFQYDLLGRLVQENLAGGAWQSYQYDLDDRKTGHNNDQLYYDGRGKILHAAISGSSNFRNFYSGLGTLAGTDWTNVYNMAANIQDTRMDALGAVAWQRSAVQDQLNHPEHVYEYEPGTSRVSRIRFKVPEYRGDYVDESWLANDTTARMYDASGNAVSGWKRGWQTDYRKEESRSYYGAADRLAAIRSYVEIQPTPYMANRRGSLVEYRYDALGRRVLVRTTRDGVCVGGGTDVDCTSGIERFVYAGDNVLWEMRGPGSAGSTPAELDQEVGTGQEYGAIGYTHAGGVDRPLAAYKRGVNAAVIAPHTNWRGQFSGGTYLQGSQSTAPVSWPGYSTTAWHQGKTPQEQNRVYMGTVLEGQRDASGQMYMRNRMYDPQASQFSQTDPIGIAGGFNTYGFAGGDPVNQHDPFGTECQRVSGENLSCTNVGVQDFYTIKNFLGGGAGAHAFAEFTGGTDPWNRQNCGRMRFTSDQCAQMAEALSHITLHSNAECRALGESATRRFQRRLYRYTDANYGAFNLAPWSSRVRIGKWAFDPTYRAPLAETIAHEEAHVRSYWRFFREGSPTHDAPGMHYRPDLWDFVWKTGNMCGK